MVHSKTYPKLEKTKYSEFIRGQDMKKSADALLSGSIYFGMDHEWTRLFKFSPAFYALLMHAAIFVFHHCIALFPKYHDELVLFLLLIV